MSLPRPKLLSHEISSGDRLYSIMYHPHNFDQSRKYPVVLNIYGGPDFQLVTNTFKVSWILNKVEKILKGSLDSIQSPSPSVKIQIMGGKVCLRCKGKTLLVVVNKLLRTKSLLTTPSKFSLIWFEFSLKVKVIGSNPGYLLKSSLL